jgi:hypothetical protein
VQASYEHLGEIASILQSLERALVLRNDPNTSDTLTAYEKMLTRHESAERLTRSSS